MMKLQSGHTVFPLEGSEKKKVQEDWAAHTEGLVRLMPGRWILTPRYLDFADKIYNFKFKENDVLVMTYPKCGTTWTQEAVWTMRNNPDLNHPKAGQHVILRAPFIELDMINSTQNGGFEFKNQRFHEAFHKMYPGKSPADGVHFQLAKHCPDPRTLKTHLPFSLLPPSLLDTAKVVYVARNPKDVIISYHHHSKIFKARSYVGNFEDFVQYFVDGDLLYGPYWLNLKEAWEKRDHPNLHFMFYEDMKTNTKDEFKKLDAFLGTNLTGAQLEGIIKHTSFSEMKTRANKSEMRDDDNQGSFNTEVTKKEGGFYRKGESGDWKGKFTTEQEAKVNQWIKKNMDSFGIQFKYSV